MDIKVLLNSIGKIKTYLALSAFVAVIALLIIREALQKISDENNIVIYTVLILLFFLAVLFLAFRDAGKEKTVQGISIPEEDIPNGYKIISKLLVFRYSDFKPDGLFRLDTLKIENYFFAKDGDFRIRSRSYDKDKITSTNSISDPLTTEIKGIGTQIGTSTTEYLDVKKGESRILALETSREQRIDGILKKLSDSEVMFGFGDKIIKNDNDTFAGTSFDIKTDHLRILLYFDKDYYPKDIEFFQIDPSGKIYKSNAAKTIHHDKYLWIVDCYSPKTNSEFYVYWNWNNVFKNS